MSVYVRTLTDPEDHEIWNYIDECCKASTIDGYGKLDPKLVTVTDRIGMVHRTTIVVVV